VDALIQRIDFPDENQDARFGVMRLAGPFALGTFDDVVLPSWCAQPDWELELAAVIGAPARRVGPEQALRHVAGLGAQRTRCVAEQPEQRSRS
jgi:2-keto-4-pentenoate hydratase/2-oxohepta-3-ene-1,7-dioic acid hydratase in catechol pathway